MEEHKAILSRWAKRTERVLLEEISRLGVQDTEALRRGISSEVQDMGGGIIAARLRFPTHGRFVDMGVGRNAKLSAMSKRKAKKWYSPAFYGRLNMLQGALGLELMEESMQALKQIEDGTRG